MYIELMDVVWITLIVTGVAIWWHGFKIKEQALRAVKLRCRELDLQFLDQTVALRSLKLRRTDEGRLQVYRVYGFDFSSTGEERYRGYIAMLGLKIQEIQIEPHRLH